MAITPNSSIYFCNVPWGSDYENVYDGANLSSVLASYALKYTVSNYSYIRKDSVINVELSIDKLFECNYLYYQNAAHENHIVYCFIEKLEYISDMTTAVYIKTDVYQTWRSDLSIPACFVEREHANTDIIGDNVLDEGLETGEYVKNSTTTVATLTDLAFIVAISAYSADLPDTHTIAGRIYNGIYSGLVYVPFFGSGASTALQAYIETYATAGRNDAIHIIFTFPSALLPAGTVSGTAMYSTDSMFSPGISKTVAYSTTTIDGYTPKNKKLLTFPYNFLHVTNHQGQSADYHFELQVTNNGSFTFNVQGAMIPGAKVGLYPEGYKQATGYNYEEGLTLQNYPLCAWVSDTYANWVAQNAGSIASTTAAGVIGIGAGIATGNLIMAAGGIAAVVSQLQQISKKQREPDQAKGNMNGASLNIAAGINNFYFSQMTIRADQAERIDQFFTMYGYKTNKVKEPNLTGRDTWNYVKLINPVIKGGIPQQDKQELRQMFEKGVTIWHSYNDFGDYSKTNAIS